MSVDVAVKAIDANDVRAASVVMSCNTAGSGTVLYDRYVGTPASVDVWYNKYNARFDNPDYYYA